MIVYPAIDLKGGQCVRLTRGAMESATVYNPNPSSQAKSFKESGFSWIHVVDLDGAFEGASQNTKSISSIVNAVDIPVQLGGGIRTLEDVEHWINVGVARVILGTAAARDPDMLIAACKAYPDKIAVGIDARDGLVALQGWAQQSSIKALDLAKAAQNAGACAIIHTDIDRDGTGKGLNIFATAQLAESVPNMHVIASGGVGGASDLKAVAESKAISGVIVGKALYNGSLTHEQALSAS